MVDRVVVEPARGFPAALTSRGANFFSHCLRNMLRAIRGYAVAVTSFGNSSSAAIRGLRKCTNSTLFCGRS